MPPIIKIGPNVLRSYSKSGLFFYDTLLLYRPIAFHSHNI